MCDRALSAAFTDRSSRLCVAFGPPSSEPLTRPRGRHNGMLARWYLRLASVPRWRDQHSWRLGIWDCFSRRSRSLTLQRAPPPGPIWDTLGTVWGGSSSPRRPRRTHAVSTWAAGASCCTLTTRPDPPDRSCTSVPRGQEPASGQCIESRNLAMVKISDRPGPATPRACRQARRHLGALHQGRQISTSHVPRRVLTL